VVCLHMLRASPIAADAKALILPIVTAAKAIMLGGEVLGTPPPPPPLPQQQQQQQQQLLLLLLLLRTLILLAQLQLLGTCARAHTQTPS
jgi:hypothetical protein